MSDMIEQPRHDHQGYAAAIATGSTGSCYEDAGIASSAMNSGGSSFDNGCVDCNDVYEIHV